VLRVNEPAIDRRGVGEQPDTLAPQLRSKLGVRGEAIKASSHG
jgi:hypothetical protein